MVILLTCKSPFLLMAEDASSLMIWKYTPSAAHYMMVFSMFKAINILNLSMIEKKRIVLLREKAS